MTIMRSLSRIGGRLALLLAAAGAAAAGPAAGEAPFGGQVASVAAKAEVGPSAAEPPEPGQAPATAPQAGAAPGPGADAGSLAAFLAEADGWLLAGRVAPPELPRLLAPMQPAERLVALAYLRRSGLLEGPGLDLAALLKPEAEATR